MKMTKRIMAVLLAVFLLAALAVVPASAASTITIVNPQDSVTYKIYKVYDFYSANADNSSVLYKENTDANTGWPGFKPTGVTFTDVDGVNVVGFGSVTSKDLAAAALVHLESNSGIQPVATIDKNSGWTWTDAAGYGVYLLVSTFGDKIPALAMTHPGQTSINLREKNTESGLPTLEKEGTPNGPVTKGSTITYKITVETEEGKAPMIHDKMTGLESMNLESVTVTYKAGGSDDLDLSSDPAVKGYVLTTTSLGDDCSFHMTFNGIDFKAYDKIEVVYTAKVTEEGIATGVIKNEAWVDNHGIGDGGDTETTPTYGVDVVKTDNSNKVINDATFKLYSDAACTQEVKLILIEDAENGNYYRPIADGEKEENIVAGTATIKGLSKDTTYYLKEITAPAGYVKALEAKSFTLTANNFATVNDGAYVSGGIQVVNTPGTALPETGGVGTTIFYVAGLVLVLAAVTVLVSKKRANA